MTNHEHREGRFKAGSRLVAGMCIAAALCKSAGVLADQPAAKDLGVCVGKHVTFTGIEPLRYADVTDNQNSNVYIYKTFPGHCSASKDTACTRAAHLIPGDSVAISKTCGDWDYVQYVGQTHITLGWVSARSLSLHPIPAPSKPVVAPGYAPTPPQRYAFTLTRGKGRPVCEAYLQRLNQTEFYMPPYCERPESTTVPGFSLLRRRWLTVEQHETLWPDVAQVMSNHPLHDNYPRHKNADGSESLDPPRLELSAEFKPGSWSYDPPVDIDNDGVPDNVVLWTGADQEYSWECGGPNTRNGLPIRNGPDGIIVSRDYHIDPTRSFQVFREHPYLTLGDGSNEVGDGIGVFKYRNVFYFDGFGEPNNNNNAGSELTVYLDRGGKHERVCRYLADLREKP